MSGMTTIIAAPRRYLMCRPTYFAVTYRINPWMDPTAPYDNGLAVRQWESLRAVFADLGHTVELIEPLPGLPDMVFAANGATVVDGRVLAVQFRDPERADEAPAYKAWFERAGFEVFDAKHTNEGEGDLLLAGDHLLAGTGFRTVHAAHAQAQAQFADLVRPRLPARGRWRKFGQANGIEEVGRERDSVDTFQPRSFCNCGRYHDGHECARDEADLGGQLWPQQQNGDDQPANDHFVKFVMEDAARYCLDVLPRRAP